MMRHTNTPHRRPLWPVLAGLALAALMFAAGCSDPYTMYQVSGAPVETGQKIMVMPFMDTRTFLAKDDPHKDDVGLHVRDIFADVLRDHADATGAEIMTPDMAQPTQSMSTAEVAEIGRQYGADVVVSGQVFSFNNTRAASIPPRAGMFVRVISAKTGALLFVGDHYQAASVPVGGGDREDQAFQVATKLVEGFLAQSGNRLTAAIGVASGSALASLPPTRKRGLSANKNGGEKNRAKGNETRPDGDSFSGLVGALRDQAAWEDEFAPEVPPIIDLESGALPEAEAAPVEETAEEVAVAPEPEPAPAPAPAPEPEVAEIPEPLPPPAELEEEYETMAANEIAVEPTSSEPAIVAEAPAAETTAAQPVVIVQAPIVPMKPDEVDELPELGVEKVNATLASIDARAAISEQLSALSGDELAEDLWETDGNIFGDGAAVEPALAAVPEAVPVPVAAPAPTPAPEAPAASAAAASPLPGPVSPERIRRWEEGFGREAEVAAATRLNGHDNGPIVSEPMVFEQPRTYRLLDLDEDPAAVRQEEDALVAKARTNRDSAAPRLLILPYHDRPNANNLIQSTGGGEVVTTLYGTQLALDPGIRLMWDGTGMATHDRLLTREEAIEMGRLAGADYVMRGQVVEFRRAQSVPSFYSAVISTAVLAAQVFFAEMSGVDVATEVYRVADGKCIMSRRDRAQQKYVVQAEKTVRRLATGMADSVSKAVRAANPEEMDPLIDELEPVTVLSNPK